MAGLKTLVMAMGVLILVGIGLVGYGLTRGKQAAPTSAAAQAGYFNSELPVPHGAKLVSVSATNDRVVLHFNAGDNSDKILLVDAHNGQVTGTVTLLPESH